MTKLKFLTGLGQKIKQLRIDRHITQIGLAIQCDFEKASMSRIESGKSNITMLTLLKISKALEVDMADFFD